MVNPIWVGKKKRALHKLVTEKNKIHVINDTDKNLGPANADKSDVINKCKRQLFDVSTYLKLSKTEMETFLIKSIAKLRMLYHTFTLFGKFLKILQWGVLLLLDTNGFLHQLLYSSDIFWRNFILNLIPFSMTAWVLLNFWKSAASIKTVFCLPSTSKVYTQTIQLMTL